MKKYAIAVGLIVVLMGGFFVFKTIKKEEPDKLIYITGAQFLEKLENKETFIAVVSQDGCNHCKEYLPNINAVLNSRDKEAYVINLTNLAKEDSQTIKDVSAILNASGTPITIFYHEGVEKTTLNRLIGNISRKSDLNKALEKQGF